MNERTVRVAGRRLRVSFGHTPARHVDERREVRRHAYRAHGCGIGFVTRRHGTYWLNARWGQV